MQYIRTFGFYAGLWALVLMLELAALWGSAWIPNDLLDAQIQQSADTLCQKPVFDTVLSADPSSMLDHYADSILLNIAYHMGSNPSLSTVMSAAYYHTDIQNENENLRDAVYASLPANQSYSRYWHGTISLLRPLLMIMPILGIYLCNAVLLAVLTLLLLFLLRRMFSNGAAICFFVSFCLTGCWFTPFSIEYFTPVIIMLIFSILVLILFRNGHFRAVFAMFLIAGSITAYMDFLTTETMTLLVPLILTLLWRKQHMESTSGSHIVHCLKCTMLWGIGYAATWMSKWVLASTVLHTNVLKEAVSQAEYRIAGTGAEISVFTQCLHAIFRNLGSLFPFSLMGQYSYVYAFFALLIAVLVYEFIKKRKGLAAISTALTLLCFVPYIRYVVLANHSYIHYFFTYRAQLASCMCLALLFLYNTDTVFLRKQLHRSAKPHRKHK